MATRFDLFFGIRTSNALVLYGVISPPKCNIPVCDARFTVLSLLSANRNIQVPQCQVRVLHCSIIATVDLKLRADSAC